MKWPKGPVGVLLGVGAAILASAALWLGMRAMSAERPAGEAPSGLSGGSAGATVPPGSTGALPGTRTPIATSAPGGGASTGSGSGSGSASAPSAPGKTAFTEAQARQVVGTFLGHIREGRPAEARAMTTAQFASSMGPDFFDRVSDPIQVVEVLLAMRDGGHWTVYCGEVWSTGPRQTRYGLAETGGKLYVESFEIAELP